MGPDPLVSSSKEETAFVASVLSMVLMVSWLHSLLVNVVRRKPVNEE